MKRSEPLRSLSRGHHQALSVAQRLRRAEQPEVAAAKFLVFWEREGAEHFRIEEEALLPTWNLLGNPPVDALTRVAEEHLQIRSAVLALREAFSLAAVHRLGDELVAHVRFEERELFPMIEADLGADELEQLARRVASAEGRRYS